MKIRVLIVDDEPLARQRVRLLLSEEADFEVVGESADGIEAIADVQAKKPDLLFLDVQMPEMDGFEVLKNIPRELMPVVVFTTAYDEHALRAFDAHALDYLLKPFKPERFKEALQRARELISSKQACLLHGDCLTFWRNAPVHPLIWPELPSKHRARLSS